MISASSFLWRHMKTPNDIELVYINTDILKKYVNKEYIVKFLFGYIKFHMSIFPQVFQYNITC